MANGWNLTNFEPAWLKIQNSEKSGPKFSFDRNRSVNNSQTSNRSDTSTSSNSSSPGAVTNSAIHNNNSNGGDKRNERCRNKSIEPVNDQDLYPESSNGGGYFSNQQPQQTRSYSRERMAITTSPYMLQKIILSGEKPLSTETNLSVNLYLQNPSFTHTDSQDCVDNNNSSASGYFNGFRSSCGGSSQRRQHSTSSYSNNDEQRSYQKYNNSTTATLQTNRNSNGGHYYQSPYHNNSPSTNHSSYHNYHYGTNQHNGNTATFAGKGENSVNDTGNNNNTSIEISNESANGNQSNEGGFDPLEQDFPSLGGRKTFGIKSHLSTGSSDGNEAVNGTDHYSPKSTFSTNGTDGNSINSTSLSPSSSIWANAAEKLRSSHFDQNIAISPVHPVKILERSSSSSSATNTLTRPSNHFTPSRILSRKDRLSSVSNNSSLTSASLSNSNANLLLNNSLNSKPIVLELPTNCITQTKNMDKRSEFFNSLKNPTTTSNSQHQSVSAINGGGSEIKTNDCVPSKRSSSNDTTIDNDCMVKDSNVSLSPNTDLTQTPSIPMPEPQEEKELLARMGWKENDDQIYTITEADREEFENKMKLITKSQEKKYSYLIRAKYLEELRTLAYISQVLTKPCVKDIGIEDQGRSQNFTENNKAFILLINYNKSETRILTTSNEEHKIIIVGLDNAGKTTILYQFLMNEVVHTSPTIGSNVEEVIFKNIHFLMMDIGGQESLRSSWSTYYSHTEYVILVVDSTDRERLPLSKQELFRMLQSEDLRTASVLIFANKQDIRDAMTSAEISKQLSLTSIKDHAWHIQACCALTGEGLYQGLDWIASRLKK
ncbi:unnamed protein product [Didymodactylos carnosus]|uniref:Uncharacterized protein n=1 Tax=Didymodactylos carnosus TaxID=1234261 RepID=A0A813SEN2_9BILA|nr:unnamed protein product [Didymodactylos carnosus]CAF0798332.1 unnamed protein product [Didymodactylos carnosus]CAF3578474.1 unnamed protein product [Didymodactylos carnosus]CAF3581519.1 unnamed protein product [Didymodactylos carnosus]